MPIIPDTKPCTKCKAVLPLDRFIGRRSGQQTAQCAKCRQAAVDFEKRKRISDADTYLARKREDTRRHRARDPEGARRLGREQLRRYRKEHPEQFKEYEKRRTPDARERRRLRKNERQAERLPECAEYNRKWRREHPEQAREAGRLQCARYRKNHPDWSSEKARRRRARKAGATGSHTAEQFRALCARYGGHCLCCGGNGPLTVDHVVPLSKGGSDSIDNIQPLCGSCNSRKHTKTRDYRPEIAPCSPIETKPPPEPLSVSTKQAKRDPATPL